MIGFLFTALILKAPLPEAAVTIDPAPALRAARLAAPSPPQDSMGVGAAMGYLSKNMIELFDANGDKALDRQEYLQFTFASYAVYHRGGDGQLTFGEYAQYWLGPSDHPFSVRRMDPGGVEREFRKLDRDRNRRVAIGDFQAEANYYFKSNDINRDGKITMAEVQAVARRR